MSLQPEAASGVRVSECLDLSCHLYHTTMAPSAGGEPTGGRNITFFFPNILPNLLKKKPLYCGVMVHLVY